MTEKLLQFIWQFQYYNKQQLQTAAGEEIQILKVGMLNTNQGPDFLNAAIKINNITLIGNIELHIKSSQWHQHNHSKDKNYNNIILHIVWQNDEQIFDANNNLIPTFELQNLIPKMLLEKYNILMQTNTALPCANFLPALSNIGWLSWKERLTTERLLIKSENVLQVFENTNHNWEETFWQILAYNFGLKVNADLFKQVAKSISINILAKHKNQIQQLEALLLGQANLLQHNTTNNYVAMLQKEYLFLQKKYGLKNIEGNAMFLRMRPANFPTIRLAQLAMLVHNSTHLFSKIKQIENVKTVQALFDITCNDFWHYHYTLNDEQQHCEPKKLGKQMIDNIIINTIIPVLFAYGNYMQEDNYKIKAIQWLQELQPEKNIITNSWKNYNIDNKSAFDSQALIHLTNNYCNKKMCLSCAVGNKILATQK